MSKDWRIDIASVGLRIVLGGVLMYFGVQKLFGIFEGAGYNETIKYMGKLGIHPLLANVSMILESLGALALICGIMTRPVALGIAANMAVATYFNVRGIHAFDEFTGKDHPEIAFKVFLTITMTVVALAIAALGGGTMALDTRLFRGKGKK